MSAYGPCSFEHFFHMVVFLNKSQAFDQLTFFCKIIICKNIIMQHLFKEESGRAIGMLAAAGSKKEVARPFQCTSAGIYCLKMRL